MKPIIPQEQLLEKILGDLSDRIPGIEPRNIVTSLAIIAFAQRCMASYEAHFARYGLSQGRFGILMLLHHRPERAWTPAALAEAAGVRRATMTGLLEVLEKGRWIRRKQNPKDGRSREIHLTPSGRKRLLRMLPDHFSRVAAAMAGLSGEEHTALIYLMEKFGTHIEVLASAGVASGQSGTDKEAVT